MRIRKTVSTTGWRHGGQWRREAARHESENLPHTNYYPALLVIISALYYRRQNPVRRMQKLRPRLVGEGDELPEAPDCLVTLGFVLL